MTPHYGVSIGGWKSERNQEKTMSKIPANEPIKKQSTEPKPLISTNPVSPISLIFSGISRFSSATSASRKTVPMTYKMARHTPKVNSASGTARICQIQPFFAVAPITVIVAATPPAFDSVTIFASIGAAVSKYLRHSNLVSSSVIKENNPIQLKKEQGNRTAITKALASASI